MFSCPGGTTKDISFQGIARQSPVDDHQALRRTKLNSSQAVSALESHSGIFYESHTWLP